MTIQLNTSHPLYGNIIELIGIDGSTLAAAKGAGRTITQMTGSSYPTAGTYGKAGRTNPANGSGIGGFNIVPQLEILSGTETTMFYVVNTISTGSGGNAPFQIVGSTQERSPTLGLTTGGNLQAVAQYNLASGLGVTSAAVVTGGAHSFALTNTASAHSIFVDGGSKVTGAALCEPRDQWYQNIGGCPGQNGVAVDLVWAVWFNRVLTDAEIAGLHASLGANNTFGLIEGGVVTPTVTSVAVTPSTATLAGAATQQFSATVTGTNSPAQTVTWSASAGSVNSSGLFTAPASTASIQTITVTATSTVDSSKAGTATVTVPATGTPAPTVTTVAVSPSAPSVAGAATQQFTVTVTGTNSPAQTVTWAASAGSINSSGLFTAPAATGSNQTITVTATSTVDGTKSGTATVTVPASVTGQIVTDILVNNAGTALGNTSIRYSWFKAGRIGSLTGIVPTEGVGVTGSDGRLTITGLPAGAGVLFLAQWITNATDDYVAYQPGTVA